MNSNKTLETKISQDWSYRDSLMRTTFFEVSLSGYYDDKKRRIVVDEKLITLPSLNKHENIYLYETILNRMKFELKETIKFKQEIIKLESIGWVRLNRFKHKIKARRNVSNKLNFAKVLSNLEQNLVDYVFAKLS